MNDYQTKQLAVSKAAYEKLSQLTKEIAAAMGRTAEIPAVREDDDDAWVKYPTWGFAVVGDNSESIALRFERDTKEQRLHISGNYPRTARGEQISKPYNVTEPTITLSLNKTPAQIAKDIERRFLPPYREVLTAVLKSKEGTDSYQSKQYADTKRLAEAFGVADVKDEHLKNGYLTFYRSLIGASGTAQVGSGVSLKLDVTVEQAIKIAKLLKG